jgi:chromosomal replication initiation ATPase DnaA
MRPFGMTGQLSFSFAHRPAYGREDFIVASCNEAAVGWIDRWPDWAGKGLVLHGPPGSGRTHLAHVFRRRSGAAMPDAALLATTALPSLLAGARCAIIDDAERAPEQPLLHLCNMISEQGGHVLLTAAEPPARWGIRLADLRSRLLALPTVSLALPDDALLGAVLLKLFSDRQLSVRPDLVAFLLGQMERSIDAARRLVAALDAAALAEKRPITIPLARRVLGTPEPGLSIGAEAAGSTVAASAD